MFLKEVLIYALRLQRCNAMDFDWTHMMRSWDRSLMPCYLTVLSLRRKVWTWHRWIIFQSSQSCTWQDLVLFVVLSSVSPPTWPRRLFASGVELHEEAAWRLVCNGGGSLIRINLSRASGYFLNIRIDAGFPILTLWNSSHSQRYLILSSIPSKNSQSLEKCSSSNGDMGRSSFARAAVASSSSSFSPSRSSFSLSFSSASHRHCSVVFSMSSWRSFSSSRCCVKQSGIFDGEMTTLGQISHASRPKLELWQHF